MAYTVKDYPTKKALKADVAAGVPVRIYNPGLGTAKTDGTTYVEGPHYPRPHTWYATVTVKDGIVTAVK